MLNLALTDTSSGQTRLLPSLYRNRFELNQRYVHSLTAENLLRPYLFEAGLWSYAGPADTTWHWGWEAITCELRGHILGHWLSAAVQIAVQASDQVLHAKTAHVVDELARCQKANGGEWLGPFSDRALHRIALGEVVWAPQYTLHKLLMGLLDAYLVANNEQALEVLVRFAHWFHQWTAPFSREKLDDILDFETGGMLEIWASLYAITRDPAHAELIERYDRPRLFDRLLEGADVLTNKHANTQIPEILGAARAWEATGETRWRQIVEAFWRSAVTNRGTYCTGGGSAGEIWQPPFALSARLNSPHEHCTVYNMMRLARFLYRWTGDLAYAEYWERNLVNAILSQQNPTTGMVSYFLPLAPASVKSWGTPTQDFWCCHGTMMQAHASYSNSVIFQAPGEAIVSQYLPSRTLLNINGANVDMTLTQDVVNGVTLGGRFPSDAKMAIQHVHIPAGPVFRPDAFVYDVRIQCDRAERFALKLRVPNWVAGHASAVVNNEPCSIDGDPSSYITICRTWHDDRVHLVLPKKLTAEALPDAPDTFAFLDGPVVLAGLIDEERSLIGDPMRPETLLTPDNERHHHWWMMGGYRTVGQERGIRFMPLADIRDERYTVYFPVRAKSQRNRTRK